MTPKIDREFQSLIPPLQAEERDRLEAAIIRDGRATVPLVVWRGLLLDGHHRHAVCLKHGLPFEVQDAPGWIADRLDAKIWMQSTALDQRNMGVIDKSRVCRSLEADIAAKAKAAQKAAGARGKEGGRGKKKTLQQNSAEGFEASARQTRALAAAQAGMSHPTYEDAKVVADKAVPELVDAVNRGDIAVSTAAELVQLPAAKQREVAAKGKRAATEAAKEVKAHVRELKRAEVKQKLEGISSLEGKKAQGVFDVLVIDPPWQMQKIERDERPMQVGLDYPTMSEAELEALNIPCAADCHVWLWTTHKQLPTALRLLDAWGLKYVCTFVWHKPGGMQPVGLPQFNCEFALYARRGAPVLLDTKDLPVCFNAARGKHSEKPEAFYETVRRITAGRRGDMFNRRTIDGFEGLGKEAAG